MSADAGGDAGLVHGLAGDLVAADWPPLTDEDARWVADRWALPWSATPRVLWRSPRPLSAAGLVGVPAVGAADGAAVFVKRQDLRVRDPESLAYEHRFARHLRDAGIEAPDVLRARDGQTAVVDDAGRDVYEVHALAPGTDLYRESESWTGFRARSHARRAGALLARLHLAAATLELPGRPFGPIADCDEIVGAADPLAALAALAERRPGLRAGLGSRPWLAEIEGVLGTWLAETSALAGRLPGCWTHGDWHPSNLTWSPDGAPVAVLDLGLSNRTTPVRDLAIAIERSCVSWLDATPAADLGAVTALLDGYGSVRPLTAAEWEALPALTATAHVEFALSEIEYYADVLASPERADIAYRDYLIGHGRWFATGPGRALLATLGKRRDG